MKIVFTKLIFIKKTVKHLTCTGLFSPQFIFALIHLQTVSSHLEFAQTKLWINMMKKDSLRLRNSPHLKFACWQQERGDKTGVNTALYTAAKISIEIILIDIYLLPSSGLRHSIHSHCTSALLREPIFNEPDFRSMLLLKIYKRFKSNLYLWIFILQTINLSLCVKVKMNKLSTKYLFI